MRALLAMNTPLHPAAALAARTYLFVPGDRPERFDKAWDSPADAVILDLEDAVAPDRKDAARDAVQGWLTPGRPVWIRTNAADTPWFEADIAVAAQPGVAGLVLPKADRMDAALLALARQHGIGLIPLIETARGVAQAEALAQLPEVVRLAFGSIDLQADLSIEGEDDALLAFRSRLVLASRLSDKLAPIDGVTPTIDDEAALRHDTQRSRRLGFGARLCIHPRQVGLIHQVLAPGDAARAWAARVVDAMNSSAGAAVAVDGQMVDRPVLLRAKAIAAAPLPNGRLRA